MKVRVEKNVVQGIHSFYVFLLVDSKKIDVSGWEESRKLTGHTGESHGLFSSVTSTEFFYGKHCKTFKLNELNENETIDKISEEVKKRILVVREWVEECRVEDHKTCGAVEFEI